MAVYDGYKAANDHLLEVTKACAVAAAKAPSLTGQLGLKMEILTGEDLNPIIDVLETLGKHSTFQALDSTVYATLRDQGELPPVLLIGADLTKPIFWDCGGCGFPSCAEFIKYSKKNKGTGAAAYGPSCLWKVIDLGIVADYICACSAMHRTETRIQLSLGAVAMFLGHLEGSTFVLALPVGPAGQNTWFSREMTKKLLTFDRQMAIQTVGGPNLFVAFSGGGMPILKSSQRWWESPTFMKVEKDEKFIEAAMEAQAEVFQKIMEYSGVMDKEKE